jgi:phospholipase A1
MKKFLLALLAVLIIPFSLNAASNTEEKAFYGISPYKDNYFIAGNSKDQVKSQISFKYHVIDHPDFGLFLGYTQQMFWRAYDNDNSSPMYDMNYNPELFWRYEIKIPYFKYIQFTPWEHKSNGQPANPQDRTWNSYGASVFNFFDLKYLHLTTMSKFFVLYGVGDRTPDLYKYLSFSEFKFVIEPWIFRNHYMNPEFSVSFIGGLINEYGARVYNVKLKPQTTLVRLNIMFQYWEGYGQNQIDYNIYDKAYRVGISFE